MSKPFKFKPVNKIPIQVRIGLYDEMIDDFMAGSDDVVEVEVEGRVPEAVYQGLQVCIKRRNLEGKVARFKHVDKVYLRKLTDES